jgi:biotin synthase
MYCGLRQANRALPRYRMTREEILDCALQAERLGYGTVVMQAAKTIWTHGRSGSRRSCWWIKRETALAVTLSLGERRQDELQALARRAQTVICSAFETSDEKLFRVIHPSRYSGGA